MKAIWKTEKKKRTYAQQKAMWGFIYVLPWLIGFIFFFLVPLLRSFQYSLNTVNVDSIGISLAFAGFANYINALTVDINFNRTLVESIVDMLVNVPLIIIFSLFVAVVLNQRFKGRMFARAMFFLPVVLASGVIAKLESTSLIEALRIEEASSGFYNILGSFQLERMMLEAGVNEWIVTYLTEAVNRIYEIISKAGVQIIIFLAGIQSISAHLYESSKIEGATGYEAFWKITFPMVSPLILVNMVYTIIDSFSSNAVTDLIRETGFTRFNIGLSSAMAWIYFLIVSVILVICARLTSKIVFYQE